LLLQARHPGDATRLHEHACFARAMNVDEAQLTLWDLLSGPPTLAQTASYDALLVGGAGEFYVSKGDLPHAPKFAGFLRDVVAARRPMFASCFGYQALVDALGGTVVHDPPRTEVGTFDLRLTEAGVSDPLFGTLPAGFAAQMGHKDRATGHPDTLVNLASSELSPFQALRVVGAPIWATQFHPELQRADNIYRYERYIEGYGEGMNATEIQAVIDGHRESPDASDLIRRFAALI
jgi:GMP synthase (glutamine-hydrolysing)